MGTLFVRPESPADHAAIAEVNRLAFGQEEEAALVTALRDADYVTFSLVAEMNQRLVGHILFGPLAIVTPQGDIPALSLAPMAVLPGHQRQGVGSQLVAEGLNRCRDAGHRIVIVLGHPDYYPRFGFSAKLAESLQSPFSGSDAWMAVELVPGALRGLAGAVKYPPPFGIVS